MKLLFRYIKDYKKMLTGVLILAAINQIFSLLDPQIFRLLIDNYASKVDQLTKQEFFRGSGLLLLAFVGVALVSRIAKNFQDYYVNVITHRLGTKLYARSVEHSFYLPYSVFADQSSGEILQKMQKARDDLQRLITGLVNLLFVYLLGIIFVLIYAFFVHWIIGASIALIVPTLAITIFFISRRIKLVQNQVVKEQSALAGATTETLRNVELVKSLGLEDQEIKRLNDVNEHILSLELKRVKLVRTLSFIQGTLLNGLRALIMFIMLYLMFDHLISLGQFFTLLFYSFFLFSPLAELGNLAEQYQQAKSSSEALEKVLAMEPEKQIDNPIVVDNVESISFEDVVFTYQGSPKHALNSISLDIKAGQSVALVGPSGSGKSTIVKLLLKLYQPQFGKIKINKKIDIADTENKSFRQKIGLVSQDTQLFSGTIRENLLFVSPGATEDDCYRVMQMAAASSVLQRAESGLDTKIGEGGIKLSGGEKQRLAIARALLRNPSILIFDEATSSLDSLTELEITKTIKNIAKERPSLITVLVAHRLSTISHVKNIYVLEKGKVVEEGSHEELVKQGGLYSALWKQQSASID
ncbi:ABC transporter ATP-binding protein/permease [Patescibacteria group bacterium]|nr:ABC transporter ATP-binding protein/permease [Patescibacteria group bacterium]